MLSILNFARFLSFFSFLFLCRKKGEEKKLFSCSFFSLYVSSFVMVPHYTRLSVNSPFYSLLSPLSLSFCLFLSFSLFLHVSVCVCVFNMSYINEEILSLLLSSLLSSSSIVSLLFSITDCSCSHTNIHPLVQLPMMMMMTIFVHLN